MKRILTLVISVIALVICFSVVASAEDVIHSGTLGELSWEFNETTGALTISGEGNMGDYLTTYPWELYKTKIKAVVIEDGVTSIGDFAFSDCSNLTSIEIPDTVISIGKRAFNVCSSLTSIEIPDSVTSIGSFSFFGCDGIASIKIPDGVTRIDMCAFEYCSNLKSIEIPDSVTSIDMSAFAYCTSLTSIEIPDSVTSIGMSVFNGCIGLTSITLPDSVISIGAGAFRGCTSITSIKIPNKVTNISMSIFNGCNSLTSIEIPDGVTSIEDYAFSDCSRLTSIKIPNSVTSIGNNAFYWCIGLTSIEIPDSVTSIGDNAFNLCDNLKQVVIKSDTIISAIADSGSCGEIVSKVKSIVVPKGATVTDYISNNFSVTVEDITIDGEEYTMYCDHKHEWASENCEEGAECTICGTRVYHHTYDNSCDTKCNVCEVERTIEHKWELSQVIKEPTKKEQGEKTYTCTVCGETKTEAIPMLEGCGGNGGITAAFVSTGGLSLVWFALRRRRI